MRVLVGKVLKWKIKPLFTHRANVPPKGSVLALMEMWLAPLSKNLRAPPTATTGDCGNKSARNKRQGQCPRTGALPAQEPEACVAESQAESQGTQELQSN